jgi:hypothetical protein
MGFHVPVKGLDFEVIRHGGCSSLFPPLMEHRHLPKFAVIAMQRVYGGPVPGVKTPTFALCLHMNRANKKAQAPFVLMRQRNFCSASASDAAK